MNWFTDPLHYEFFQRGLIVAILVGGLCGTIGTMIVLRRMSYIGHGLSHAVFGGAVVAYLISVNFYVGAGLWGFLAALLINAAGKRRNIGADAAIGIVTTASFALGVALISRTRSFTRNFDAALFGNILGVTETDIMVIAAVALVVAIGTVIWYRQLLFTAFDSDLAMVFGVPSNWVDTGFALALAATIVVSMNVVGVTLIAAAIVIPPSTARLLTNSFGIMIVLSCLIGAASGGIGMFLSFHLDISSGSAIVLLSASLFALTYAFTSLRSTFAHRGQRVPAAVTETDMLPEESRS